MPKEVLILDSTQLSLYDECPYHWNLEYGKGFTVDEVPVVPSPWNNPENPTLYESEWTGPLSAIDRWGEALMMGSYGHKLLELYYKGMAQGLTLNQARDFALESRPSEGDKVVILPDYKAYLVLDPLQMNKMHQIKFVTPFVLDPEKQTAVRERFNDYWNLQIGRNYHIIPDSPESVEVGFSETIYEDDEKLYILEGKIDLIGTVQGLHTIIDHKFQLRMRNIYSKTIQFRNYAMIGHANMLIINYIRLTKKIDGTTFDRGVANFSPPEHAKWRERLKAKFDQIYIARKYDEYEQRWGSCSGKYGYPCDFTKLCEPFDKRTAANLIQLNYTKKELWKPW